MEIKTGYLRGTGAAINVSLGWVPDRVTIINLTDGDKIDINSLDLVMTFTSGSVEPVANDVLKDLTNGGYARVKEVILDTGSWAGGDAAGWIIFDPLSLVGTIGAAGLDINGSGTDSLTGSTPNQDGVSIGAAVTATTTDATNVKAYAGSDASAAKGFTIGATMSEDGKLLFYEAIRSRDGGPLNNSA